MLRRFQKIDVNEPTIDETIKILKGLKTAFEDHHKVKYTPDALKTAVELSARYINDRKLPDKAIDVIDEVGAMQMLVPPSRRKKKITAREIESPAIPAPAIVLDLAKGFCAVASTFCGPIGR